MREGYSSQMFVCVCVCVCPLLLWRQRWSTALRTGTDEQQMISYFIKKTEILQLIASFILKNSSLASFKEVGAATPPNLSAPPTTLLYIALRVSTLVPFIIISYKNQNYLSYVL